ncbi:MAG: PaaI family thioesterase [Alphaproteobacteria bacterium]|nr:PaaI family thioesterase [Alphaproteobacteria bacterium]
MTESAGPDVDPGRLPPARAAETPPPGYTAMVLSDPFEAYVGPFFERTETAEDGAERIWLAFRVDERHLNGGGHVHGGMLMTFADAALGTLAWRATGRTPSVTLSMETEFLKGAGLGDLVEVCPILTRRTRAILFIRATFHVRGEPILHASSLWKIIGA